jgi:mannose-6-phosphate isomerase-like protein (cupin superfamily)
MEISGDDHSIDEVVLQPGVTANWLRFVDTRAQHQAIGTGAIVEIAGGRPGTFDTTNTRTRPLSLRAPTILEEGEWHRLSNPTKQPVTVHVTLSPTWNPARAYFRLNEKEYRGDGVWFEVRTHIGDKIARAMYQLHSLSADLGNVSARLAPGAASIETFHRKATVTISGTEGEGVLRVDGATQEIRERVSIVVNPGQHYQLLNTSKAAFQVNQLHKPQWEPHDTFYVEDQKVIPGNQVWFDFVVPD